MFFFNTNSWHYKLVNYVFGDSLFVEKKFDVDATVKIFDKEETEFHTKWGHLDSVKLKEKYDLFKETRTQMIYKSIPKTVNLCPYLRAVVAAVTLFPFAIIAKRIPKREKKPFDIEKSRRNTKIIRIIAITIFAVWGTYHLLHGDYLMAAFQYSVASFHWWGKYLFEYIAERAAKKEEKQEDLPVLPKKNPATGGKFSFPSIAPLHSFLSSISFSRLTWYSPQSSVPD